MVSFKLVRRSKPGDGASVQKQGSWSSPGTVMSWSTLGGLPDEPSGTFLMEEANLECDPRLSAGSGDGGVGGRGRRSGGERLTTSDC